jgi:hypothetical protein
VIDGHQFILHESGPHIEDVEGPDKDLGDLEQLDNIGSSKGWMTICDDGWDSTQLQFFRVDPALCQCQMGQNGWQPVPNQ